MKTKVDTVIIGAGLTGLTTAFYLQKYGHQVVVLEKDSNIGGVMQTHKKAGFTFEQGPNTGVISNTEVVELFDELKKDCEIEIANPEAKKRLIWKGAKWHALPNGLLSAIKTPLFSLKDKFRILGEPWRSKGVNPNESVAELVKRRMGKSFLEYAVDPFISGIYAGNPNTLVTQYALPKLYLLEQEYGSFIRGAIKKRKLPKTELEKRVSREVFSAKGGLHQLINALGKNLKENTINLDCKNTQVEKLEEHFLVKSQSDKGELQFEATNVISTISPKGIEQTFPFISKQELAPILALKYAKVAQVILGFENWKGSDVNAFGGLVPTKEKRDVLGVLFTSSFLKNRAPKDGVILSTFVGGIQHEDIYNLSDRDLLEKVHQELSFMLKADTKKADIEQIFRYPTAIPQYEENSKERFEAIANLQETYPGLFLAGNIRDGIGMADRIKQARSLAENLKKTSK